MKGRPTRTLLLAFICGIAVVGVMAAPASALSPSVETLPASAIGETGATLNGKINPNGLETKYFFEYGTTTSYGSKTAEISAGSGSSAVEKSQVISGLTKNTVYHYRLIASNASGTSQGVDKSFTTTAASAPTVTTWIAKMEDAAEAATVQAFINPKGQSTTYQFEYGTESGSYTTTVPIPAASAGSGNEGKMYSYKITGLTPGTKYYVRPSATNATGKTYGKEIYFPLPGSPVVGLSSPSQVWRSQATLNGSVDTEETITTYYFQYGTTTAYGSKTATKELAGGTESVNVAELVSGLKANTLYHYRLVAGNGAGMVVTKDDTFTTLAPATLSAGEQLKVGANLVALGSLNFESRVCGTAEFTGTVSENPGSAQTISAVKIQNGELGCSLGSGWTIFYKKGVNVNEAHTLQFATNGSGQIAVRTSPEFHIIGTVYIGGSPVAECEYNLSLTGTAKAGSVLQPYLGGEAKWLKGNFPCPWTEGISGSLFTVFSNGSPVAANP